MVIVVVVVDTAVAVAVAGAYYFSAPLHATKLRTRHFVSSLDGVFTLKICSLALATSGLIGEERDKAIKVVFSLFVTP